MTAAVTVALISVHSFRHTIINHQKFVRKWVTTDVLFVCKVVEVSVSALCLIYFRKEKTTDRSW